MCEVLPIKGERARFGFLSLLCMVELRCTYRAGFGPGGSCTVPGQGHDDIALLSSPVDHHLVVRVVQVGLQETGWTQVATHGRGTDTQNIFFR